jgi:uncharacterized protein (TIGR02217 family)
MSAAFVEVRLERGYDYGAQGGPEYSTSVVVLGGGQEARNIDWEASRGRWEIGERRIDRVEKDYLLAFFRARRGRAQGFRFKDWADFQADGEALDPTGAKTVQLIKSYADAGDSYVREITKPVAGTVSVKRGGTPFSAYTLDTTTGLLTLTPDATVGISAITQASPGVVTTAAAHGLTTGDTVYLTGIGGMTELNGRAFQITVIDPTSFSLDGEDTSAYGAYTSGGTVESYVQPSESLTWTGEFDVPVRFDADSLRAEFQAWREADGQAVFQLSTLPVVELRV